MDPLHALLRMLDARSYSFVTPTPFTCRRMAERPLTAPPNLRDILGWSRAFGEDDLDPDLLNLLRKADCIESSGERLRSTVRVSTVHGQMFLHSAFPTDSSDAVFLGPDSYRFADFVAQELVWARPPRSVLEVGTGAGVGGLIAAKWAPSATVMLTDVNPKALRLAAVNAAHAAVPAIVREASGLDGAPRELDLIVANPPYIAGRSGSTYADGGGLHGAELSLEWTKAAMDHLAPSGRLLLYTGSAILDGGIDQLRIKLEAAVGGRPFNLRYREIDPDVFSEILQRSDYADVERLAVIGAVITRNR